MFTDSMACLIRRFTMKRSADTAKLHDVALCDRSHVNQLPIINAGDHTAPHGAANTSFVSPSERNGLGTAAATSVKKKYEKKYTIREHKAFLDIIIERRAWTVNNTDDGCWLEIAQELETKVGCVRVAATLREHFHQMLAVTKSLMKSDNLDLSGDLGHQLMNAFDQSGRPSRCWWDADVFSFMVRIRNAMEPTTDIAQDQELPLAPPVLPTQIAPLNMVAQPSAVIPDQAVEPALNSNRPCTVVVNTAYFGHTAIPYELSRVIEENDVLTLLKRDVIKKMLNRLGNTRNFFPQPMYLTGPGGVGKSSCLFMAAAEVLHCNASQSLQYGSPYPIFLLYIANSGELVRCSPEEVARRLLKLVEILNQPLMQAWNELADLFVKEQISTLIAGHNLSVCCLTPQTFDASFLWINGMP